MSFEFEFKSQVGVGVKTSIYQHLFYDDICKGKPILTLISLPRVLIRLIGAGVI